VASGTRDAGRGLKAELRRQVSSAGLGQRLANSWRDKHYPNQELDAATLVYTKGPQIIRAFDEGAVIRSKRGRFLAIPTENAPRKGTDGKRISPRNFSSPWRAKLKVRSPTIARTMQPPVPQYIEAAEEHENRDSSTTVSGTPSPLRSTGCTASRASKIPPSKLSQFLRASSRTSSTGPATAVAAPSRRKANARCLIPLGFPASSRAALPDLDAVSDGFTTQRQLN
jgi:Family of unknown function (DUF6441)